MANGRHAARDFFGGGPARLPRRELSVFPQHLSAANGTIFFDDGTRLFASDGTAAGTVQVFAAPYSPSYHALSDPTVVGGRLYFAVTYPSGSSSSTILYTGQLWTSDGTTAGTVVTGGSDLSVNGICTSHVERNNLTIRTFMRRFTRLSLGFSKKLPNLSAAVALHVAHDNFCRVHGTLRTTPAMAAEVTDHVWTLDELMAAM